MAASSADDLTEHTKCMEAHRARGLDDERLAVLLDRIWERARTEFVRECELDPHSLMVTLDGNALKCDTAFKKKEERALHRAAIRARLVRLGMLHVRARALQDTELCVTYKLCDVHFDWTDTEDAVVYFRCQKEPYLAIEDEVVDQVRHCLAKGSSMCKLYASPDVFFGGAAQTRIEAKLGFKVNIEYDEVGGTLCTWDRSSARPLPDHPSWDEF